MKRIVRNKLGSTIETFWSLKVVEAYLESYSCRCKYSTVDMQGATYQECSFNMYSSIIPIPFCSHDIICSCLHSYRHLLLVFFNYYYTAYFRHCVRREIHARWHALLLLPCCQSAQEQDSWNQNALIPGMHCFRNLISDEEECTFSNKSCVNRNFPLSKPVAKQTSKMSDTGLKTSQALSSSKVRANPHLWYVLCSKL